MSFNYQLAKEIYGSTPWMVDCMTFGVLKKTLEDIRNNVPYDVESEKNNSVFLYDLKSKTRIIDNTNHLRDNQGKNDSLVYVVNLDGPITKNGGLSSNGTKQISQQILSFDSDPRVKGGILLTDSGGGSTNAVEHMADAMTKRKKPLVQLIEKGGVSASAAGYIGSYSDYIISESPENIVGSYGTMITIEGQASGNIDSNGIKHLRIYASASTKKNLDFEEALNNDNYELIINNILDPANTKFLSEMKKNRPNILESQLDGSIYKAGDVIGTLVDSIGTFEDAVNKVLELSTKSSFKINNNHLNPQSTMTVEDLKAQFPAVYNSVFNAGVTSGCDAERDRCGAWMAHASTDIESVKKGIESGKDISATAREEFLVKANSKQNLAKLEADSTADITTPESAGKEGDQPTEVDSFYKEVQSKIK